MTKFIIDFTPETCISRRVGEMVSLLESLYLNVSEPMKFQMEPDALEELDEYKRIAKYWEKNYCVDEANKRISRLKKTAKEGTLFAIKFNSPIILSKDKLLLSLCSQITVRPCCGMILTEDQIR